MIKTILGDCRDIIKTIPDASVDALVTDPPFGIGFKYKDKEAHDSPEAYWEWLRPILVEVDRCLKPGALIAIWQTQLYFPYFWQWFGSDIHIYAACKNFVQMRKSVVNYAYDPVIIKYKEGADPLAPASPRRNVDWFCANTAAQVSRTDVLARKHPCPRPLDQTIEIVENFSTGTVLDLFLGSGTTALACKKLKRDFIGIEIDQEYLNIANDRLSGLVTCDDISFDSF
jgi:DNA modification methylase